jgi:hypothetical protein
LLLPYAVALTEHLGRAEGEPRLWSKVSLLAPSCSWRSPSARERPGGTLAFAIDDLSDQELRLLMRLDIGAFQTEGYGLGLFVFAASLAAVGAAALRRWVGILGLVSGLGLGRSPRGWWCGESATAPRTTSCSRSGATTPSSPTAPSRPPRRDLTHRGHAVIENG